MEGIFHSQEATDCRYQYNGIEYLSHANLNVSLATWRTHDPAIGRWWQVDPKAEVMMGYSPFNSMGCNPMSFSDPNGDVIVPMLAIWASLSAKEVLGNNTSASFGQFATNAGISIGSAYASAGIGSISQDLAHHGWGKLSIGIFQAVAHGTVGGFATLARGGSFGKGFLSSGAGSAVSSLIPDGSTVGMLLGGTLSGGVAAELSGGDFWDGALQGLIVSGLNHALHDLNGPGDPPKKGDVRLSNGNYGLWESFDGSEWVSTGGYLMASGQIESTDSPVEWIFAGGAVRTGGKLSLDLFKNTYKAGASLLGSRWVRKNIISFGKTKDGGNVVTLFDKIKYIGYRKSYLGQKHDYTRSIKINTGGGNWKHIKDF